MYLAYEEQCLGEIRIRKGFNWQLGQFEQLWKIRDERSGEKKEYLEWRKIQEVEPDSPVRKELKSSTIID